MKFVFPGVFVTITLEAFIARRTHPASVISYTRNDRDPGDPPVNDTRPVELIEIGACRNQMFPKTEFVSGSPIDTVDPKLVTFVTDATVGANTRAFSTRSFAGASAAGEDICKTK